MKKKTDKNKDGLTVQKKRDLIFYISWFALPLFIYFFGLFIVNGNSLLLAFKSYDMYGNVSWVFLDNFKAVWHDLFTHAIVAPAFGRSVKVYLITTLVTNIIPIMFSYYIYKKMPLSGMFKIILFIPSLISGIVTVFIFKTISERIVPYLMETMFNKEMIGLVSNPNTAFNTVLFYGLWMSFGGGLLINLATMNTVDESVKEAGELDGVGFFQEFWYIVLPASYQVLSLGIITGFASLFTNDMGLFAFYGGGGDSRVYTLGYYFFVKTLGGGDADYPYLSAWGLMVSAVAIPVTLFLRHLVFTYGPSED